jgi:hypothetical protein
MIVAKGGLSLNVLIISFIKFYTQIILTILIAPSVLISIFFCIKNQWRQNIYTIILTIVAMILVYNIS